MNKNVEKVLISEQEIKAKVVELGKRISEDYKDKELLMVGILKGSLIFMSDLMRAVDINCKIDFMSISSYSGTESTGQVRIILDLNRPIKDYDLLIVEDILDSGVTLSYIKQLLTPRCPRSIKICTLLDKPERRKADIKADYYGFTVPDEFVIGYGLDYDEDYRNLPYIGVIKDEAIKKK